MAQNTPWSTLKSSPQELKENALKWHKTAPGYGNKKTARHEPLKWRLKAKLLEIMHKVAADMKK